MASAFIPARQWRSLAELAHPYGESSADADEFLAGASEGPAGIERRRFLQLIAASMAMGGGVACTRQPLERIIPYVHQPEALKPGEPLIFATAMELGGHAHGLLVRSDDGRPTKIDGNPQHPGTLGRSSVHMQAALLDLYDPDRSQSVRREGQPATWEAFLGWLISKMPEWKSSGGAGLRFLTRSVGSPTLEAQMAELLARYQKARWHVHDAAFPIAEPVRYHLDRADTILSLDADLFGPGGLNVRATADYAQRRRSDPATARLYALESMPSLTGAMADHRRALPPGALIAYVGSLAQAVQQSSAPPDDWGAALLNDLTAHRGRSVVAAGAYQPPVLHELARSMNNRLGNTGTTVEYFGQRSTSASSLVELVDALNAGEVQTLVILDANPVYEAPADLRFGEALQKATHCVHHGLYFDETAESCSWHIPASHFLEAWSDARAFDGSETIVQPLIEPLYASKSAHELLGAMLGQFTVDGYELIRERWRKRLPADAFESAWRRALHDGIAPASPTANMSPATEKRSETKVPIAKAGGLELIIRPDPHVLDGRTANNAWLQELPRPFTKLTWENAAHLSAQTARRCKVEHGDIVELRFAGRSVAAPVWILPGHADNCVTIHLGFGRTRGGRVADGLGFNAFALQTSEAPWGGAGLEIRPLQKRHVFASTQEHQRMEGRSPVHVVPAGEIQPVAGEAEPSPESLYPPVEYGRPAWGMVLNLDACIGCSVCTIACQAENNIPVVGRDQVLRGREMHWIRVDTYYEGAEEAPQIFHQPVPCMHCENAPCELVCPVAATVHDHDGLNLMVYNRCIGTRYCSNNCPYKVRRFNFYAFADTHTPQFKLMRNPEVTVRSRGVMEKCTYCVQRISAARITAEKENRLIRDGEVIPACAQACPADAIAFGDIHDPASRVAAWRKDTARHYALLSELNTRPRTTYLARRQNRNRGLAL